MITPEDARGLFGAVDKNILDDISQDIKRASLRNKTSINVDFIQGSDYDRQSTAIIEKLKSLGYKAEYGIEKWWFIDFGFRFIKIDWSK